MNMEAVDVEQANQELQERMTRLEPLDDRLRPYLRGNVLTHPLVFERYVDPERAAVQNEYLEWKLDVLKKARPARAWCEFIFAHERPYRIEAFSEVAEEMTDAEYWEILGCIWGESRNIWQFKQLWRSYWLSDRPMKELAMDKAERQFFAGLPNTITVYRGQDRRNCSGMSWSLRRDIAHWFATRFASRQDECWVLTATVRKANVHAFFHPKDHDKGEHEIVAHKVTVLSRELVYPGAKAA